MKRLTDMYGTFAVATPGGISRKKKCSVNAIQRDTNVLYIQGLMPQLTETHILSQAPTSLSAPKCRNTSQFI